MFIVAVGLSCVLVPLVFAAWQWCKYCNSLFMGVDSQPHAHGLKVVITGGTRGLGFALARQFLALGDDVAIASRSPGSVTSAVGRLRSEFPGGHVLGVAADVGVPADVERLASEAAAELGALDVWVCCAGLGASQRAAVHQTPAAELAAVVNANLLGALLCARAAAARMLRQPQGGRIFLVDGRGSNGLPTPQNAAYGASKAGLVQLKDSLAAELRGTRVSAHMMSPGMVATPLLLRLADNPRSARFINVLADPPDDAAAWLVPRLRGARGNGTYVRFFTPAELVRRLCTARGRRNRFVPEDPESIAQRREHAE